MPVEVRYYTDPACPRSWAAEPALRRLMWEFGDALRFRWVMGGLARTYGATYSDDEAQVAEAEDTHCAVVADWLRVTAESGMPIDPRLWLDGGIESTYPACQALKAAAEQGFERAYAYLRRLREGMLTERRKLDHREALIAEAQRAGLDVERFRIDLVSNAITEAFASDLDEVRAVADDARAAGGVRNTEGRERVAFPSARFVAEDGSGHAVWGRQRYDAYREAALAAGAKPGNVPTADPLTAIDRFGRAATREIELLTGRPRPVVEAELWGLAREWRVRPVPVLNGTLWEIA